MRVALSRAPEEPVPSPFEEANGTSTDRSCNAHTACAAFSGTCCPTLNGVTLFCCSGMSGRFDGVWASGSGSEVHVISGDTIMWDVELQTKLQVFDDDKNAFSTLVEGDQEPREAKLDGGDLKWNTGETWLRWHFPHQKAGVAQKRADDAPAEATTTSLPGSVTLSVASAGDTTSAPAESSTSTPGAPSTDDTSETPGVITTSSTPAASEVTVEASGGTSAAASPGDAFEAPPDIILEPNEAPGGGEGSNNEPSSDALSSASTASTATDDSGTRDAATPLSGTQASNVDKGQLSQISAAPLTDHASEVPGVAASSSAPGAKEGIVEASSGTSAAANAGDALEAPPDFVLDKNDADVAFEEHVPNGGEGAASEPSSGDAEEVSTTLAEPLEAGATEISVASQEGFSVGDVVIISSEEHSETREIVELGSIIVNQPLKNSYPSGASVTRETLDSLQAKANEVYKKQQAGAIAGGVVSGVAFAGLLGGLLGGLLTSSTSEPKGNGSATTSLPSTLGSGSDHDGDTDNGDVNDGEANGGDVDDVGAHVLDEIDTHDNHTEETLTVDGNLDHSQLPTDYSEVVEANFTTALAEAAVVGATSIEVESQYGMEVSDAIRLCAVSNMTCCEEKIIVALGSVELDSGLKHEYPAGSTVELLSPPDVLANAKSPQHKEEATPSLGASLLGGDQAWLLGGGILVVLALGLVGGLVALTTGRGRRQSERKARSYRNLQGKRSKDAFVESAWMDNDGSANDPESTGSYSANPPKFLSHESAPPQQTQRQQREQLQRTFPGPSVRPSQQVPSFEDIDANKDGLISRGEFMAFAERCQRASTAVLQSSRPQAPMFGLGQPRTEWPLMTSYGYVGAAPALGVTAAPLSGPQVAAIPGLHPAGVSAAPGPGLNPAVSMAVPTIAAMLPAAIPTYQAPSFSPPSPQQLMRPLSPSPASWSLPSPRPLRIPLV